MLLGWTDVRDLRLGEPRELRGTLMMGRCRYTSKPQNGFQCMYRPWKRFQPCMLRTQASLSSESTSSTTNNKDSDSLTDLSVSETLPCAADLKKKYYNWKGYKVAYVTAGCGEPVLLVHGFGASAGHYRRLIPVLAQEYKVYAIDLLGFGDSEKPLIDYEMEIWDEQIRCFLEEYVQKPAVIIGNSVGSLATLMASVNAPDLVRGVVLLNCAGGMNNKQAIDDWRIKLIMPLFLLIDFLLKQPRIAKYLFDNVREKETLRKILLGIYPSNPEAVDEDLVDMLHNPSCDVGALETFVSCITGPPGPRPETLVPEIKGPLLIIWGEADTFTPSDGPVGQYFQNLPTSRPETDFFHLPNVGHAPQDEAPDIVLQCLLPWLKRVVDGSF